MRPVNRKSDAPTGPAIGENKSSENKDAFAMKAEIFDASRKLSQCVMCG